MLPAYGLVDVQVQLLVPFGERIFDIDDALEQRDD